MASAAKSTLYFASGKTLDVQETVAQITSTYPWPLVPLGHAPTPACCSTLTAANGDKHWVNLSHVERIGPA